jgi:hypothetical protein
MSYETGTAICEHEWEEYDDPAAYNDGFNAPVVAICRKCGAWQDIRHKYVGSNKIEWYKTLLFIPVFLFIILYLVLIAPIIMVISAIRDEFFSKGKAGR